MQGVSGLPVLVTGASGFIGCYVSIFLKRAGADVRALGIVRNEKELSHKRSLIAADLPLIEADFGDPYSARSVTEGVKTIIHLGAAHQETGVPDDFFFRVNAEGTRNLLTAACKAGAQRFIYASSIGVFGTGGSKPLSELSPVRPNNAYGRSKVATEKIVNSFADRIAASILRISETYGDGDFRLLKLFRAAQRKRLLEIGDGCNLHQPIHVDDLNRCIFSMLDDKRSFGETYIVAGSEVVSSHEMIEEVANATTSSAAVIRLPLGPFGIACKICESVFSVLDKEPPLHQRRLEFFTKNLTFDTSKLNRQLGFQPRIRFSEGCRRSAIWYRHNGLLN